MKKQSSILITEFNDYRKFLKAKFFSMKEKNKNVSYGYLAKKTETANSYFKLVFEGKRHIALDKCNKIGKVFKLSKDEINYLVLMVILQSISDKELHSLLNISLARIKNRIEHPAFVKDTHGKFDGVPFGKHWLKSAIVHLSGFPDFRPDAEWIQNKLVVGKKFDLELINQSIQELISEKVIKENNNLPEELNSYITSDDLLVDENPMHDVSSSIDIIREYFFNEKLYSPSSLNFGFYAVNKKDCIAIHNELNQCIDKIMNIAGKSENPDHLLFMFNLMYNMV